MTDENTLETQAEEALRAASVLVAEWQSKVTAGEAAIAQLRIDAGKRALSGHGKQAAADLRSLEDELAMDVEALKTARQQQAEAATNLEIAKIETMVAAANAHDQEIAKLAAVISEYQPKLDQALTEWKFRARQASQLRTQADDRRFALRQRGIAIAAG